MAKTNKLRSPNKQVFFSPDPDTQLVALTPHESGMTLDTLIEALLKIQGAAKNHGQNLTVIYENAEADASWTIQAVAFDGNWLRLS